jgi:predicted enzyme related to lactoylglutathione lyase
MPAKRNCKLDALIDLNAVEANNSGRVSFFLNADDFATVYEAMRQWGVHFLEAPRSEPYGTVAVFADLYGNRWDLLEPRRKASEDGALRDG